MPWSPDVLKGKWCIVLLHFRYNRNLYRLEWKRNHSNLDLLPGMKLWLLILHELPNRFSKLGPT